jgi:hypothetical protein
MGYRYVEDLLTTGVKQTGSLDTTKYSLPTVPSASQPTTTDGNGITVSHVLGAVRKAIVNFKAVALAVTDDGSTGSAYVKFLSFPASVVRIHGVVPNVAAAVTASWNPSTPVMSIGTTAAGANATLTTTEADVVRSTALTITSDAFTFAPDNTGALLALTDSSTGVASATGVLADATGTFSQSVTNANIATLAVAINALTAAIQGMVTYNGTDTAKDLYLNFACNADPSTGKTITLTGTIEITYSLLGDN